MSAQFLWIEQVYYLSVLAYMEFPVTEELFSEAMDWLIGLDDVLGVWVDIGNETGNSEWFKTLF